MDLNIKEGWNQFHRSPCKIMRRMARKRLIKQLVQLNYWRGSADGGSRLPGRPPGSSGAMRCPRVADVDCRGIC